MTTLLFVLGIGVLLGTTVDIIVTTASVSSGRGPVSSQVAAWVWSALLAVHTRTRGHRLLQAAGPVILFGIILTWLVLLIVGWALTFTPADALTGDGGTLDMQRRLHFAATTILGRGSSAVEVADSGWWLAEQLCGLTGVALISLSIAYVLPVVAAVAHKRQVAASVMMLGRTPQEILVRSWDGDGFADLDLHLINLAGMVNVTSQRHLAYPVLYYFHSPYREFALAPAIAVLDETLTLIADALTQRPALSDSAWRPTRAAVDHLLMIVGESVIRPHDDVPPRPDLAPLGTAGLPVRDDATVAAAIAELADRRRLLHGFLVFEGRDWPTHDDVVAPAGTS